MKRRHNTDLTGQQSWNLLIEFMHIEVPIDEPTLEPLHEIGSLNMSHSECIRQHGGVQNI